MDRSAVIDLPENLKKLLIEKSVESKSNAYAPYSKFPVGAALLTTSGEIFTGCNVENASYSLGICAERTAVCKAVSEGFRDFKAVAVSTDMKEGLTPPCGACRQVLVEFAVEGFVVILVHPEGKHQVHTLDSLLPHSFGPRDLSLYRLEQGERQKDNPQNSSS